MAKIEVGSVNKIKRKTPKLYNLPQKSGGLSPLLSPVYLSPACQSSVVATFKVINTDRWPRILLIFPVAAGLLILHKKSEVN